MMNPGQVDIGNVEDANNPTLPLMKKYYNDAFKKYAAKEERWGLKFAAGIAFAEPLVKGLQLAGRDLTREKLVEKMESISNFQGIMGRVSYKPFQADDPSCRLGQKEVFLAQATENGKYKVLTDWIQTEYVNYE